MARHGEGGLRTLGPFGVIYTERLFGTNNDALTSLRVTGILGASPGAAGSERAGGRMIQMVEGGENDDNNTPHRAADRRTGDNHIDGTLRARRPCCREIKRRVLGSLGPRRQRTPRKALPRMGREAKGRA